MMKHDKRDRVKILVLAVILIALWVFIGIRFVLLSKERNAKLRAEREATTAAQPGATSTPSGPTSQPQQPLSPALRLAALVAPVSPPKSDPFRPLIAPRFGSSAQPAAAEKQPTEREEQQPPPVLPPLPSSEQGGGKASLQLTGIILGTPSTAVLRLGNDHYVVREGDVLQDSLRVQKITKTTITLRDGRAVYTLRLGG